MPPRYNRLMGNPPTYNPFPEPPEQPVVPRPITDGIYSYSSTGFAIMSYRPKRPSELLAAIAEQYEEREKNRFGQEVRGGRGSKKGKNFFRAHLTWYGLEYSKDDTVKELEERLFQAMSARPPPSLPPAIYEVEATMRQRWLGAASAYQQSITDILTERGETIHTSDILAELTGATTPTDDFFQHPPTFFQKYFPPSAPPNHVVVLMGIDTVAEQDVWEWCCDMYRLKVEKVGNDRGTGRDKGRFPDFVIGKDGRAVRAKANQIRQENAAAGARYRPY